MQWDIIGRGTKRLTKKSSLTTSCYLVEPLEGRRLLSASLLANLNTTPAYAPFSDPTSFAGHLLFTTRDNAHGDELWSSDGTSTGTTVLKDINFGPSDSSPRELTVCNGMLFFSADDGVHGRELWKTDGTSDGTRMVADIDPGWRGSDPVGLESVNGVLFFQAYDPIGLGVYTSDGTEMGTALVKRLSTGVGRAVVSEGSVPTFSSPPTRYYFVNPDPVFGEELWSSDGTEAGTAMVKDINPGPGSSYPGEYATVGNYLYFTAENGPNGFDEWRTDGTAAGTIQLTGAGLPTHPINIQSPIGYDGQLFFLATDPANYHQVLLHSDGTPQGTGIIKELNGSYNTSLVVSNGLLYFSDVTSSGQRGSLWRTDGTPANTTLVGNFPGLYGAPGGPGLTEVDGNIIFKDSQGLAACDGTVAGTHVIAAGGTDVTNVDGKIFFNNVGALFETTLNGGATQIATFPAGDAGGGIELAPLGNQVVFGTTSLLGVTDGTPAGTKIIASGSGASHFVPVDNSVYFADGMNRLWKTDGTSAGTVAIPKNHMVGSSAVGFDHDLFFFDTYYVYPNGFGYALYKTDGTETGTSVVAVVNGGGLTVAGHILYFLDSDPNGNSRLWASDGTASGTAPIMTFPSPLGVSDVTSVGNRLFFIVGNTNTSIKPQLWVSDGTVAGTAMLRTFTDAPMYGDPFQLSAVGQTLYFMFVPAGGSNGIVEQLWKSDGTPQGTIHINVSLPDGRPVAPNQLLPVGGTLYFASFDPTGYNLWKSDGTSGGTVPIASLGVSGGLAYDYNELLSSDGVLYFGSGSVIGRTDGTAAGTYILADVTPAADPIFNNVGTVGLALAGDHLIFGANNGINGNELWQAPTDVVPPLAQISPVSPHFGPIDQLTITFNRPMPEFQLRDLSLARSGGSNLLSAPAALSTTDDVTFTLTGLSSLTASPGTYTLSVIAPDPPITDGQGESFLTDASTSFQVTAPPAVTGAQFNWQSLPASVSLTFNEPITLSNPEITGDLEVKNLTTGQVVPVTFSSYDPGTDTATYTFTSRPQDGNYKLSLTGGISDQTGDPLAAPFTFSFFWLTGDLNHDGRVNFQDFNILATHFWKKNVTYAMGDINGDGMVNFVDFHLFEMNFGRSLPILSAQALQGNSLGGPAPAGPMTSAAALGVPNVTPLRRYPVEQAFDGDAPRVMPRVPARFHVVRASQRGTRVRHERAGTGGFQGVMSSAPITDNHWQPTTGNQQPATKNQQPATSN